MALQSWIISLALLGIMAGAALRTNPATLPQRPSSELPIKPAAVAAGAERLFVIDDFSNRLFVYDTTLRQWHPTGHIGSGAGDFYHPNALAVGRRSIAVLDSGNQRVQLLTHDGHFEGEFQIPARLLRSRTIAIDSHDNVYLNDPESGWLVTKYDNTGRACGHVGKLVRLSDLYPNAGTGRDTQFSLFANQVWLTVDEEDNLYIVFVLAPVVQKYNGHGQLVFRQSLSGPAVERLRDLFWNALPGEGDALKTSVGGVQADLIIKAVSYTAESKRLYALSAINTVFELSPDGRQVGEFALRMPAERPFDFLFMAADECHLLLSSIFIPHLYEVDVSSRMVPAYCKRSRERALYVQPLNILKGEAP